MTNEQQRQATDQQVKYLGYLLARARERGKNLPYLPVGALSKQAVSDWIDYLKTVVGEEEGEKPSPSSSLSCRCGIGGCGRAS